MTSSTNDKLWNVLCHLSLFLGVGLILPLIVYLVTKDDLDSTVPAHAKETLNFHISAYLYAFISAILIVVAIGAILLPVSRRRHRAAGRHGRKNRFHHRGR